MQGRSRGERMLFTLACLWVVVGLAAYLAQFVRLIGPIAAAFGWR